MLRSRAYRSVGLCGLDRVSGDADLWSRIGCVGHQRGRGTKNPVGSGAAGPGCERNVFLRPPGRSVFPIGSISPSPSISRRPWVVLDYPVQTEAAEGGFPVPRSTTIRSSTTSGLFWSPIRRGWPGAVGASLLLLILFVAPSGAGVVGRRAVELAAESGFPQATYYRVRRPDLRLCPAPTCGGVFVERVNRRRVQCADGRRARECHAAISHSRAQLRRDRRAEAVRIGIVSLRDTPEPRLAGTVRSGPGTTCPGPSSP